MPIALRACIENIDARLVILSYNDESWIALDELLELCAVTRRRRRAGVRLGALRRRADRDPQPGRRSASARSRTCATSSTCSCAVSRRPSSASTAPYDDRRVTASGYADAAIIRPRSRNDGVAAPSVNSACLTQRK